MQDPFEDASRLADEALDLTIAGRLSEARPLYEQAIALATSCDHWSRWNFHGQFGGLLAKLRDTSAAEIQYRAAVDAALGVARETGESDGNHEEVDAHTTDQPCTNVDGEPCSNEAKRASEDSDPAVIATRYSLADFLLSMGRYADARETISLSLLSANSAILWLIEAEALWALGRHDEAREAAERALSEALTEGQRAKIEERLAKLAT